jgi:hypothetical protein
MINCPEGHPNPPDWEFCGECGAPIDKVAEELENRAWYRTKWAIMGAGALAVVVIAGAAGALIATRGSDQTSSTPPTSSDTAAIQEWWSAAHKPFTELQESLNDSRRALDRANGPALEEACEQMHDSADVDLQAHMPTPDPELTSLIRAATVDAHAAAHMCLSVVAGSVNSYDGEFLADVDQAEKQLLAAQELINKALISA